MAVNLKHFEVFYVTKSHLSLRIIVSRSELKFLGLYCYLLFGIALEF